MSIHIQTANGLVNIAGDEITEERIIEALNYVPAREEALIELDMSLNMSLTELEATLTELIRISLENITDDESGELIITDDAGNIIFKVDENGVHSVNFTINGVSIEESFNDLEETINNNISTLEANIDEDINALKTSIDGDINTLKSNIDKDIDALETSIGGDINTLETNITEQINTLEEAINTHSLNDEIHIKN